MTTLTYALLCCLEILVICKAIVYFKIDDLIIIPWLESINRRLKEITEWAER